MKEIKKLIDRILETECDVSSAAHSVELESVLLRERLEHLDVGGADSKIEAYFHTINIICDKIDASIAKIREDLAALEYIETDASAVA